MLEISSTWSVCPLISFSCIFIISLPAAITLQYPLHFFFPILSFVCPPRWWWRHWLRPSDYCLSMTGFKCSAGLKLPRSYSPRYAYTFVSRALKSFLVLESHIFFLASFWPFLTWCQDYDKNQRNKQNQNQT